MPILVVDAGNSRLRAAIWRREGPAGRLEAATPATGEARRDLVDRLAALAADGGAGASVVCSVVPALDDELRRRLPAPLLIDHTLPMPFDVEVREPRTVGADRWCNVAAAVGRGWADALVVDAGTATTFDLLDGGVFRGGLIAPGIGLAADALMRRGARLPRVELAPTPLRLGRDTASALRTGCWQVGARGVVATAEALLRRHGPRPVVLTGGLAGWLRRRGWRHEPDWTLEGAVRLARPRPDAGRRADVGRRDADPDNPKPGERR